MSLQLLSQAAIDHLGTRSVELWCGDLTAWPHQYGLLCFSAAAESYLPLPGSFIESIETEFDIGVATLASSPDLDLRDALGVWSTPVSGCPFDHVVCLEATWLPGDPARALDRMLDGLLTVIAYLDITGRPVSQVCMPLIGTGYQGFPVAEVVNAMVSRLLAFMRESSSLERVAFVERDAGLAEQMAGALATYLGRSSSVQGQDPLLESIRLSIVQRSRSLPESAASLATELAQINPVRVSGDYSALVTGRKLAEAFVADLLQGPRERDLYWGIREIADRRLLRGIDVSHLHTLRVLGNEAVHGQSSIIRDDVIVCMTCIDILLDHWLERLNLSGLQTSPTATN